MHREACLSFNWYECTLKLTVLICIIDKTDGKNKIIQAEAVLGRFQFPPVVSSGESVDVPWILTKDQLQLAKQRLRQISIPNFNPQQLFTHLSRLKSHDWMQVYLYMT